MRVALISISDRAGYAAYERASWNLPPVPRQVERSTEAPVVKEGAWPYTRTGAARIPRSGGTRPLVSLRCLSGAGKNRFGASEAAIAVIKALPPLQP
jgi:hypothetical protein